MIVNLLDLGRLRGVRVRVRVSIKNNPSSNKVRSAIEIQCFYTGKLSSCASLWYQRLTGNPKEKGPRKKQETLWKTGSGDTVTAIGHCRQGNRLCENSADHDPHWLARRTKTMLFRVSAFRVTGPSPRACLTP